MRGRGLAQVLDPARDLLLGTSCLGCERPGRLVCPVCLEALDALRPAPAWPTPVPAGLVAPWAAATYAELPRAMVLGLKERGQLSLVAPLADLLAATVGAGFTGFTGRAIAGAPRPDPSLLVLVPVPSRPATVRARGHDAVAAFTRQAARRLRAGGLDVLVCPLLRQRPGVADQSGLDAAARRANLEGSMTCPVPGLRRLARRVDGPVRVVVCDDVVTTGSTLAEAQRSLRAVGLPVVGAATITAARRSGRR